MQCKICGSNEVFITYDGKIRNGGLGNYTDHNVKMWKCQTCNSIWHDPLLKASSYYESTDYRISMEGTSDENTFYALHDKESLDKFLYTGTTIFRNKVVADIGCGAGAFLDYVKGPAKEIVAIEPSKQYRNVMKKKGFTVYPYSADAIKDGYTEAIDVVVSFDVIEHVEDPMLFVKDIYKLLKKDGVAIIGTPTEAPIMRELLGSVYEQTQLFSTQHLWVFGEKSIKLMAENAGFWDISIKFFQRYGFDNFIGWLREKKPRSEIKSDWITRSLDSGWRGMLEDRGLADYVVGYLRKK